MSAAIHRVITGVSGSSRNLPALRYAAVLAQGQGATLIPLLTWTPPGGDLADRRRPSEYLRQVWQQAAWDRLWHARCSLSRPRRWNWKLATACMAGRSATAG